MENAKIETQKFSQLRQAVNGGVEETETALNEVC